MKQIVRFFEQRVRFLDQIPKHGIVLDCGCGDFESTLKLKKIRPDIIWHCIDRDSRNSLPDGVFYKACNFEVDQLPYSDSYFDAIIALHVVEHITNLEFFSREIGRLLKQGGNAYFEVPSVKSMLVPGANFYDDITHKRPYTRSSLKAFIQVYVGLDNVKVGTVRNLIKILLTPMLIIYSLFARNNYYIIGLGDIIGLKLYGTGSKR